MIKKQVEYELAKLSELTTKITQELQQLPTGVLHEERNGPYFRYYLRQNGKKHFLHKKDEEFILALATRKHLTNKLESLKMQHASLSDYLLTLNNDLSPSLSTNNTLSASPSKAKPKS